MGSKAIKVSESTYERLRKLSEQKNISMKEVVDRIVESTNSIEDYRGSWDIEDEEVEKIREERENLWENWDI